MAPHRTFPPLAAVVLAVLLLAGGSPAPARAADCAGADLVPAAGNLPQVAAATACLLDEQRAVRGLSPTRRNVRLEQASLRYSRRMVAERFFAHVGPDGEQLTARLLGSRYISSSDDYVIGENLAWGEGDLSTPRSIVAAWMNSPGHRENVLRREFAAIGLGAALGTPQAASGGATITAEGGARTAPAAPRCGTGRPARTTPPARPRGATRGR